MVSKVLLAIGRGRACQVFVFAALVDERFSFDYNVKSVLIDVDTCCRTVPIAVA